MSKAVVIGNIELTPTMLAKAFWQLGSCQQVEFLDALAAEIQFDHKGGNTAAYSLGEPQWFFVGDELEKPENAMARNMLMTMAAPLYLHTLEAAERDRAEATRAIFGGAA